MTLLPTVATTTTTSMQNQQQIPASSSSIASVTSQHPTLYVQPQHQHLPSSSSPSSSSVALPAPPPPAIISNTIYDDIHDYFYQQQLPSSSTSRVFNYNHLYSTTVPTATTTCNNCWTQYYYWWYTLIQDLWDSIEIIFHGRIVYLLMLGPIVIIGDTIQIFDKSICFTLSGITLIPCAERITYLTEQIAFHTNGTISALVNATFGNAPELLISIAALRMGYYRIIQLTMLGSMITNMIFIFGLSCIIGGVRYQTQYIRIITGNVTIGMLMMTVIGSLIPATLVLSGQFIDTVLVSNSNYVNNNDNDTHTRQLLKRTISTETPTQEEITLSRVNASVLMMSYICYIIFQLGSHKDEFDDHDELHPEQHHHRMVSSRPNIFCRRIGTRICNLRKAANTYSTSTYDAVPLDIHDRLSSTTPIPSPRGIRKKFSDRQIVIPLQRMSSSETSSQHHHHNNSHDIDDDSRSGIDMEEMGIIQNRSRLNNHNESFSGSVVDIGQQQQIQQHESDISTEQRRGNRRRRVVAGTVQKTNGIGGMKSHIDDNNDGGGNHILLNHVSKSFDHISDDIHYYNSPLNTLNNMMDISHRTMSTNNSIQYDPYHIHKNSNHPSDFITNKNNNINEHPVAIQLSLRVSIVWLFIITLCVSALSDILVDTIDEFAIRMHLSQVFTSMIIVPFFSNVAEQVSAFIFAYRNEMDLVVGVTIGSAIQIATFVLPGSVLIGYILDRSMTLYFHSYETVCLLVCTLIVAAILQGGTTNWLVGVMLVGVYIMFAAGIWFHEIENLNVDTEILIDAVH